LDRVENILISVERKYVARMLSGRKTIELRRRRLRLSAGTKVWIYSTSPHALVEVVAKIARIVNDSPEQLWDKYKHEAGVTKEEFDSYFSNSDTGCAVVLQDIQPMRTTVSLATLRRHARKFHPPQFFMRLRRNSDTLKLLEGNAWRSGGDQVTGR
jgi:predicted transcriptional regulator